MLFTGVAHYFTEKTLEICKWSRSKYKLSMSYKECRAKLLQQHMQIHSNIYNLNTCIKKNTKYFVDDHCGIHCTIMVHTASHKF